VVAAAVEVVGAAEAEAAVGAEVEAEAEAAVGNLSGTTHPLKKGGKSHGATHQYKEKKFMV
jgi:hypothetical protein